MNPFFTTALIYSFFALLGVFIGALFVLVFYVSVKLASYAWHRGRYLVFESQTRRSKRWQRQRDEDEKSESV